MRLLRLFAPLAVMYIAACTPRPFVEGDDLPGPEFEGKPVYLEYTCVDAGVHGLSGLCLTAGGSALWAVGDKGWFGQMDFDGVATKYWGRIADMEGITIDPATGSVYIAQESASQSVARVKGPDYTADDYEVLFKVKDAFGNLNSGLEGITFYKDNTLYVGTQKGANLYLYNLEGECLSAVSLKEIASDIIEVAGLCYDPERDWLWVSDSESHRLYVFDGAATTMLTYYPVPFIANNESVYIDRARNCVWVGSDESTPKLYKLQFQGL